LDVGELESCAAVHADLPEPRQVRLAVGSVIASGPARARQSPINS
jgi:hypothetical protein